MVYIYIYIYIYIYESYHPEYKEYSLFQKGLVNVHIYIYNYIYIYIYTISSDKQNIPQGNDT